MPGGRSKGKEAAIRKQCYLHHYIFLVRIAASFPAKLKVHVIPSKP
jgi:hypothetical protein